jgi:CheY-like chemotaxis protein
MPPRKPIVLVVTEDRGPSEVISAWLREDGLDVVACPGPQAPSYVCAGGRGEPCPLAADADVVVLDLWLASDTMLTGTPALQLLSYYTSLGKPVVGLERPGDPAASFVDGGVELVRWPPERRSLLRAVRGRLAASATRQAYT